MNSYKKGTNLVGWLVFLITGTVMIMSVERTGSLWDCGEFVSGCYKLQVVHPPGAPFFSGSDSRKSNLLVRKP